ncbi:MAG: vWA domain-containing protein [bacterium]
MAGISDYWRKNTSACEPVELANLLRGIRKVAGHLGPNVARIEYAGMSRGAAEAAIVLDPDLVMGRYPVPPEKVDYLVGLVVHEALHGIEWSDRVWKLLEPAFRELGGLSLVRLQKIVKTGEDIYVDSVAEPSVFGLYTPKARERAFQDAESRLGSEPGAPSIEALLLLWWARAWGREPGWEVPEACREPLRVLGRLEAGLKQVAGMNGGVAARCRRRADLYLESWEAVRGPLASWAVRDKLLHWVPSFMNIEGNKAERHSADAGDGKKAFSGHLLTQIEMQLALGSADITPIIRSLVGDENEEVVPTSRWDFNMSACPVIDRRVVTRLKSAFESYSARRTAVSRGLLSGKVDARRLHRAPLSGRCFLQVDRFPDLDWNVALLMDASGSMRGTKWRMVENTVANLHKALATFRSHLRAYAYFEMDGVCMISQLLKGGRLLSVPPCGQTASGQAILAAAYFMPKGQKRNLLVHVTDGESNLGCDVRYGIEYCRRQGIQLVTLGCGCKDRQAMVSQYGRSLQFLDHYGQLPRAVERLLKFAFLYGGRFGSLVDRGLRL